MAVDLLSVGTECSYARSEIVTGNYISSATEALQAILIDEQDKIFQSLMDSEGKCFPAATLLPFAIRAKTENLMFKTLVARCEGKTCR